MQLKPVDLKTMEKNVKNTYEGVIVASRRARQINDDVRKDFSERLKEIAPTTEDDVEEKENPEQLKLSLEFEKKPKPHLVALKEMMDGKIEFRYKDTEVK
ncbi:MAG: DNA-directed RNA polymerase subunit omega [Ignavibacteriales bacterium]|nr:DNA-directed RNA polymerase subunit omega [Ignavibacteriales bacterium]MCF8305895.1 DNA-directed RNA polymerase subunit omega [Ignavibacteriales bacterium]MCF8315616.1 DNA-directed RNA polymerase subunit omega [Ignavibacteriales bacterium]MCF8437190.1 DNA-directed RNA polymerase subunit omega [Ignavibacteriales bacterium]